MATAVGSRLRGGPVPDIGARASERWEVAPGSLAHVRAGIFLPGQVERIRSTEFASLEDTLRALKGGFDAWEGPTMGLRVADVDLVDGVLYGSGAQRHLRPRARRRPAYRKPREAISGALYESWTGNRWFGTWLADDCLTYRLAEAAGQPVTTTTAADWSHRPGYESALGMAPRRVGDVHFDELILFEDLSNNAGKADRARDMRARLLAGRDPSAVPGVFLLRGRSGAQRLLLNEAEIAERLATEYGFTVLDPVASAIDVIAAACGRAAIVAGVEGSHLFHGAAMMPPDAVLLVIQPPDRTTAVLKALTDRQGQGFAFVVAEGGLDGFAADWTEVRRTLDMALEAQHGAPPRG